MGCRTGAKSYANFTRNISKSSENLTIKKDKFPEKKLDNFIFNSSNINEIGKVIIQNKNLLTIQRGKPYFFPNCQNKL